MNQIYNILFDLLRTESNTILRKIFEAMFIFSLKPNINDKEEKKVLERFLVSNKYILQFCILVRGSAICNCNCMSY